jgi:hypothetical protein
MEIKASRKSVNGGRWTQLMIPEGGAVEHTGGPQCVVAIVVVEGHRNFLSVSEASRKWRCTSSASGWLRHAGIRSKHGIQDSEWHPGQAAREEVRDAPALGHMTCQCESRHIMSTFSSPWTRNSRYSCQWRKVATTSGRLQQVLGKMFRLCDPRNKSSVGDMHANHRA